MTQEVEYEAWAQAWSASDLMAIWAALREMAPPPLAASTFPEGRAFEYLIVRAFALAALPTEWPFRNRVAGLEVGQIDGAVYVDGQPILIEAKDKDRDGAEAFAKLAVHLARRPGNVLGLIVVRGELTANAKLLLSLTSPQRIIIWEGTEWDAALRDNRLAEVLRKKVRQLVLHGIPDYDTEED